MSGFHRYDSGANASRMLTTSERTLQMRKTRTTIISITASFISFFCDDDSIAERLLERLQKRGKTYILMQERISYTVCFNVT